VVPTPLPFEYYSSGTETDSVLSSVFSSVQRFVDPQWRDQAVCQISDTVAMPIRRSDTSPVDTLVGNVECTGTALLVCPTIQQVSQVLPAEPRAEGARQTAREERVTKYPGELRAQDARVSTPPQGSCGRPADPHAGSVRQATQVQHMNGHTPVPPANGVGRGQTAAPQEAPTNPVSNGFPQRLPQTIHGRQHECYSVPVDYYQMMGRPQEGWSIDHQCNTGIHMALNHLPVMRIGYRSDKIRHRVTYPWMTAIINNP